MNDTTPNLWPSLAETIEALASGSYTNDHRLHAVAMLQSAEARVERLDEVRAVVRETIIPALEAAQKYIPGSEVRNWPPGFRLRDDAMRRLPDALAAARKTLEDEQQEGVTT